jgi:8-oxo-dGTP diphosphatase
MAINRFTIRVYGILLDDDKRILVSDEFIRGDYFTKFPGGGLELGEGTRDCVQREFKEETGLDILVGDHIYTTDYFQQSAFNPNDQIISIYYYVQAKNLNDVQVKTKVFDFELHQIEDLKGQSEVLRWVEWNDLNEDAVSLPIDKIVVRMLKEKL